MEKINFSEAIYQKIYKSRFPVKPLVPFFKYLVSVKQPSNSAVDQQNVITKSKLKIFVPYTVVYGIEESPVLYYTDTDGCLVRVDNISFKTIKQKLTFGTSSDTDLAVVMKRFVSGDVASNATTVLNVKQLLSVLDGQISGMCVFQRYVKSCGSKPSVARIIWSSSKQLTGYVISNKKSTMESSEKDPSNRFLTNSENLNSLDIFQLRTAALRDLGGQVINLVKYLESLPKLKLKFETFAVDFIRDDDGRYWYLQTKGFALDERLLAKRPVSSTAFDETSLDEKPSRSKASYLRCKECKMCLNLFSPSDLACTMSLKMIFATEQHLKRRAVKMAWFDRPEFKGVSDTSSWYQDCRVCKTW